jgi:hypothetical protein
MKEAGLTMQLTDRELATVLAALRYWQQELAANNDAAPISDHFQDGPTPLTVDEIDDLCERLNLGPAAG